MINISHTDPTVDYWETLKQQIRDELQHALRAEHVDVNGHWQRECWLVRELANARHELQQIKEAAA